MKRLFRKLTACVLAAVMLFGLLPVSFSMLQADAEWAPDREWEWTRFGGLDRYETMGMASQEAWPEGRDTMIITSGQTFPDALCASALAGVLRCPVLLTNQSKLPEDTKAEIQRLAPSGGKVLIIGGTGAVSKVVQNEIRHLGMETERIAGADREETAQAVFEQIVAAGGFREDGTLIIASGHAFSDVLSISPYAYAAETPILLTKKNGSLSAKTKSLIEQSIKPSKVILVGGTGAVSKAAEQYLKGLDFGLGVKVLRLAGTNRYETSAEIMRWELGQKKDAPFQPQVKMSPEGMGIATGLGFADALGAVSLLGETLSPLLLVADNNPSNGCTTQANIDALVAPFAGEMTKGYIFGGTAAVSEEIEEWLTDVIPAGPLPYIYETPEEIVRALYLLNPGEELSEGYPYELTGTVTEIFTPYSEKDQNLSVTMVVEGMTDKPILCFQLKADPDDPDMANALPGLKAGDTITVRGKLTNLGPLTGSEDLYGFGSYCRMISYEGAPIGN